MHSLPHNIANAINTDRQRALEHRAEAARTAATHERSRGGLRSLIDRTPGRRERSRAATWPIGSEVVIRRAHGDDATAVKRLAALDSKNVPTGELLVAEVDGELWAALPLDGGEAVADPFHFTADLVSLLALRATQLRVQPSQERRLFFTLARPRLAPER